MSSELLDGRYAVGEIIGRGGLGVVRRAQDVVLDREVAIKSLRSELAQDTDHARRLDDEAKAAASLTHPNAVVLFDVLNVNGDTHLVMELIDGLPLPTCLRGGRLSVDLAALVGRDVSSALAAAHARGLVHRDIKPSNMLVSREGTVKLSDFGIARLVGSTETRITAVGSVIGSAAYLAPEQLLDEEVTTAADVYALGLVLGEIITGSLGFGEGTTGEILMRRLSQDPARPSTRSGAVPREFDDLIVRMTSRDPAARPRADDVASGLARLVPRDARDRLALLVPSAVVDVDDLAPTELLTDHGHTTRMIDPSNTEFMAPDAPLPDATALMSPVDVGDSDDWESSLPTAEGSLAPPLGEAVVHAREAYVHASRFGDPLLRRVIIGALGLIGIVVLVAVVAGGESPSADPVAEPSSPTGAADGTIAFVSGASLDPLGDGREHDEDIAALFDGDASTQWETEGYKQPNLGGKAGVGFVLDLGEERDLSEIDVVLLNDKVDLEVWVSTEDPAGRPAPDVGEKVGSEKKTDAGTLTFKADVRARWVMIWIKRVGDGRAEIGEVTAR